MRERIGRIGRGGEEREGERRGGEGRRGEERKGEKGRVTDVMEGEEKTGNHPS